MVVSKENILRKTQYGFKIYAFIIRDFYEDEKFLIAQHFKHPLKNPFNEGRKTLNVYLENGIAKHQDLEIVSFKGDVFDFANHYYKMATNENLYNLINQIMHLGLKSPVEDALSWLDEEDDSWVPEVSYFEAPISNVNPSKTLSLAEVHSRITGNDYKAITERLRAVTDPKERSTLKSKIFPYVTFSGVFKRRSDLSLIRSSFLMTFDFDHLEHVEQVREQLLSDDTFDTELLFTSPSGNGVKWIIRWDPSEGSYSDYFKGVSNYLKQRYDLVSDKSGKDVSRACFTAFDSSCYLNPRHRKLP